MRNRNPAIACPHPARGQAQNTARFGINTQHRVQQNTASQTLADLVQTATALSGRRKIDFAGALDRQNMPARSARRMLRAPSITQHPSFPQVTTNRPPIQGSATKPCSTQPLKRTGKTKPTDV